ncbi:MAG TPA: hypothetical protein VF711_13545 [Acidimicrobiales bacterium]
MELVTDPVCGVPWVLTLIGPDGGADCAFGGQRPPKMTAGPYRAAAPSASLAAMAVAEPDPSAGSATAGLRVDALAGALAVPTWGGHPSFA